MNSLAECISLILGKRVPSAFTETPEAWLAQQNLRMVHLGHDRPAWLSGVPVITRGAGPKYVIHDGADYQHDPHAGDHGILEDLYLIVAIGSHGQIQSAKGAVLAPRPFWRRFLGWFGGA